MAENQPIQGNHPSTAGKIFDALNPLHGLAVMIAKGAVLMVDPENAPRATQELNRHDATAGVAPRAKAKP